MGRGRCNCYFSFSTIFCPFTPLTARKTKISKKWKKIKKKKKKQLKKSSFYTSVPKLMIICYNVPEIWCMTDVIAIFSFWAIFRPFYPPNSPPKKLQKTWKKKHLEISLFYGSVPKTMIMCYTILEIWHVMDVIVVFHFGQFFALLPL